MGEIAPKTPGKGDNNSSKILSIPITLNPSPSNSLIIEVIIALSPAKNCFNERIINFIPRKSGNALNKEGRFTEPTITISLMLFFLSNRISLPAAPILTHSCSNSFKRFGSALPLSAITMNSLPSFRQ